MWAKSLQAWGLTPCRDDPAACSLPVCLLRKVYLRLTCEGDHLRMQFMHKRFHPGYRPRPDAGIGNG
jgi:hypothetical protein